MRLEFKMTRIDVAAILLAATVTVLTCLLLSACSMGIRETYDKGVLTERKPYLEFGQMQTQQDYASIDITKLAGFHASYASIGIDLGYGMHVRMLLKPDANGDLPVVVIDTGVNPFEKDGVTDTVLTGKEAVKEFYLEEAR